jgi:hypothetical protein
MEDTTTSRLQVLLEASSIDTDHPGPELYKHVLAYNFLLPRIGAVK